MMDFKDKYHKYKKKYLSLNNQYMKGGDNIIFRIGTFNEITNDNRIQKEYLVNKYNDLNEICFKKKLSRIDLLNIGILFLGYIKSDLVVIGTVSEGAKQGEFIIYNVCVHPDYRNRGLCNRLMMEIKKYYKRKADNCILILDVHKVNYAAIKCYEKAGFSVLNDTTKPDKYTMTLNLI